MERLLDLKTELFKNFSTQYRSLMAILDQGFVAVTNFVLSLLLVKFLSIEQYGAFATTYTIFLLVLMIFSALFCEPMVVFASGKYSQCKQSYIKDLLFGHIFFSGLCILLFTIFGLINVFYLNNRILGSGFWGIAILSPFYLMLWLLRRAFYTILKIDYAVIGGIVYLIVSLILLLIFNYYFKLSVFMVFLIMAIASIISSGFLYKVLFHNIGDTQKIENASRVFKNQWNYGKWAICTAILLWIPQNFFYSYFTFTGRMIESGILKAVYNFISPVQQIYPAISLSLLPIFVRTINLREKNTFISYIKRTTFLFTCVSLFITFFFIIFSKRIAYFVYDQSFTQYAYLIALSGILPLISGPTAIFLNAIRAFEMPRVVNQISFYSSLIFIIAGILLIAYKPLDGVIFAQVLSSFILLIFSFYFTKKLSTNFFDNKLGRENDTFTK